MICGDPGGPDWDQVEFLSQFRRRLYVERVPIHASFELTRQCNLRCVHCYVPRGPKDARGPELTTAEYQRIMDACAEAGTLTVSLTGGEPLLRKDFAELYVHAGRLGIMATVFTNATLIDERMMALFKEWPPRGVEVTLYGATESVYERITGIPGSYAACRRGMDRVAEAGLPLQVKTILMTLNQKELAAIRELARSLGAPFRSDASIFPRLNGDRSPLEYRVSPDEAAASDFEDDEHAERWAEFTREVKPSTTAARLYHCGAGRTGLHVNAEGMLQPCVLTAWRGFDLRRTPFAEAWRKMGEALVAAETDPKGPCRSCEKKMFCGYCPAFFKLETGSEIEYAPFMCELGRGRERRLARWKERRSAHGEARNKVDAAETVPETAPPGH